MLLLLTGKKDEAKRNSDYWTQIRTTLWAAGKNEQSATKLLHKDLRKLAKWCVKWRIKLNLEKPSSSYSPGPLSPEIQNPSENCMERDSKSILNSILPGF